MKQLMKSLIVAFSMYSKIPMPRFIWDSEDMKYHLVFFPLVGGVIGLLEYIWFQLNTVLSFNLLLYTMIAFVIPLLITGGFHLDGFLDTQDALHSYQNRERKLEILKDPHIGAFAIISLLIYVCFAFGFIGYINQTTIVCMCAGFVYSRICSGISVTYFPKAKKDGMVVTSSKTEDKTWVGKILIVEFVFVTMILFFVCDISTVLIEWATIQLTFFYYYYKSKKEFGGITGDLAGWFVCVSELAVLIVLAVWKGF
ncbi:MAG: adenosylcobinamide-GDP ribazoletransferase [Firmicutes bacterium]|nr:adenosylcobinamide-GDP ribazoletransferase [Bacillota bacterium]